MIDLTKSCLVESDPSIINFLLRTMSTSFSQVLPGIVKMAQIWPTLRGKPYIFLNVLQRWCSQKIALEYDPSCIIKKDGISFPENMILWYVLQML